MLSAIEAWAGADPAVRGDEELIDELLVADRVVCHGELARMGAVAEIERRGLHRESGHTSVHALLVDLCTVGSSKAQRTVVTARSLDEMPVTRQAAIDGVISLDQVPALVAAQQTDAEGFAEAEADLVDQVAGRTVAETHRVVDPWRHGADEAKALCDANRNYQRRRLTLSPQSDGMVRVDGRLDEESGAYLTGAIDAIITRDIKTGPGGGDRTGLQRRADALVELARRHGSTGDGSTGDGSPGDGESCLPVRARLNVLVDLEVLERRAGGVCEIEGVGAVVPELIRRLGCDATVCRIVTRGASMPLDVGRTTRVVPAAIRTAVTVRDRTCVFPGCDRPPSWCDAHHIIHWADGGDTCLDNVVLLCRRHHRLIHEDDWMITGTGDRPEFRRHRDTDRDTGPEPTPTTTPDRPEALTLLPP